MDIGCQVHLAVGFEDMGEVELVRNRVVLEEVFGVISTKEPKNPLSGWVSHQ
jgi:hypothetical protein